MNENKKYPKSSIFRPLRHIKYIFKKPVTHPLETIFTKKNADYLKGVKVMKKGKAKISNPRTAPDNLRGFHVNDWEKCIGCGTCGEICPTAAITMVERQDLPRVADLVTDVDSKLVVINRFELENLMNKYSHLGKIVMQNVAKGLSRKLRRTS